MMHPLRITAKLATGLAAQHPVALDSLLAAMVAARDDYPPASLEQRVPPPESVPLLWHPLPVGHPCGRGFHHASMAHLEIGSYETIRGSRKAPALHELADLTSADKVPLAGRFKGYWMPLRKILPAGMTLTWWAVGDLAEVAELLRHCFALGSKRGAGHGWVSSWTVEPWHEDWSLLRPAGEGEWDDLLAPSRPLPAELAPEGWMSWDLRWLSYPYWRAGAAPLVAVPEPPEMVERGGW